MYILRLVIPLIKKPKILLLALKIYLKYTKSSKKYINRKSIMNEITANTTDLIKDISVLIDNAKV